MRAARVDAVLVDVGGVLHLPGTDVVRAGLERVGVGFDPARLPLAHHRGMAAYDRWRRDHEAWAAYLSALAIEMGAPAEFLELVVDSLLEEFRRPDAWSTLIPGAVEGLRALHAAGIPLAVVSNSDGTVEERLRAEGILQAGPGPGVPVAVVVDSESAGVAKPDPRIFSFALLALEVSPVHAVHVGDSVKADVAGALAAGIRPLHMDPFDLCVDRSHEHVHSLHEVLALVRPG